MPINSRIDPRLMNDGAAGNQWEPPMMTGPISYPSPWTPPSPMPPQGRPPMPPQSNRPPWAGSPGGRFGEMPRPDGPPGSPFQPSPLQTGGLDPMPRPIPGPMPPSPMPTNPDWYYPTGGAGEEFRPTGGHFDNQVPVGGFPTQTSPQLRPVYGEPGYDPIAEGEYLRSQPAFTGPTPMGGDNMPQNNPVSSPMDPARKALIESQLANWTTSNSNVGGMGRGQGQGLATAPGQNRGLLPAQAQANRQAPMPRPEEIGQALQQHYGSKGGNASPPPAQFSGQSPTAGGKGGQQAPPSGGKGGNQGSQDYTPLRSRNGYRGG